MHHLGFTCPVKSRFVDDFVAARLPSRSDPTFQHVGCEVNKAEPNREAKTKNKEPAVGSHSGLLPGRNCSVAKRRYLFSDGVMFTMWRVLVLESMVATTFTFCPSYCFALSWSSN